MNATITITGSCPGGNHVFVTAVAGNKTRQLCLHKADILNDDDDFLVSGIEKAVIREIRRFAKRQSITTYADLASQVSNLSVSL